MAGCRPADSCELNHEKPEFPISRRDYRVLRFAGFFPELQEQHELAGKPG